MTSRTAHRAPLNRVPRCARHAVALAVAALLATPASAVVIVNGPWHSDPLIAGPLGGANLLLPNVRLFLGANGSASLFSDAGSQVQLAALWLANYAGNSIAVTTLDGAGTVLSLHGNGNSNRVEIGSAGTGTLTVRNGALFDGRADWTNCLTGFRSCNTFIGNAAGSTGQLTVTGAGSEARFLSGFLMGHLQIDSGFGVAGGLTRAGVLVQDGGLLRTEEVTAGTGWVSPISNGQERAEISIAVIGPGSRWIVDPRTVNQGGNVTGARASLAADPRSTVAFDVRDGGRFEVVGAPVGDYGVHFGAGGTFNGLVTGVGSAVVLSGEVGRGELNVGAWGGVSTLTVNNGARLISSASLLRVGLGNGTGTLVVSGSGSQLDAAGAHARIGSGGTGRLQMASGASATVRSLFLGGQWSGSTRGVGDVVLDGAGTLFTVTSPTEATRLHVGDWGDGTLSISGGAFLVAGASAAECLISYCTTVIGHSAGSNGRLTVSGSGSELTSRGDTWVGSSRLFTHAVDGYTMGTPGGITRARVEVLAGGTLRSEFVRVGTGERPETMTGTEQSFSEMVVSGAGSLWSIYSERPGRGAEFRTGFTPRSSATIDVAAGGVLRVASAAGLNSDMVLGINGGSNMVTVRDAGSRLEVNGATSRLTVGGAAGTSTLVVRDGGAVSQDGTGWSYLNIGETGSIGRVEVRSGGTFNAGRQVNVGAGGTGTLIVDGAGSLFTTDRRGTDGKELTVGALGTGRLEVTGGGTVSTHTLRVGGGSSGTGGTVVVNGAGSTVVLDAPNLNRLSVPVGDIVVSGGALMSDAVSGAAAPCNVGSWCGALLANDAGNRAALTVTGAGSKVVLSYGIAVGGSYVGSAAQAGLSSLATVTITGGGRLESAHGQIGNGPNGPFANGSERVQSNVTISGVGSAWVISPRPGETWAALTTGHNNAATTTADIRIDQGGLLRLTAAPTSSATLGLGETGGTSRLVVTGAGSKVEFTGTPFANLWVGRNGALASMRVEAGAAVTGAQGFWVGRGSGTQGTLVIDGPGSRMDIAASVVPVATTFGNVGQQGGTGSLAITNGGVLSFSGSTSQQLNVGQSGGNFFGSLGSLRVDGASLLSMNVAAPATGSFRGDLLVGSGGFGSAEVSNGGRIVIAGGNSTTSAVVTIGGSSVTAPSSGTLTVRGAGSVLDLAAANNFIRVGQGSTNPAAFAGSGTLSVVSAGEVRATNLHVGSSERGVGTLVLNAGRLTLAGRLESSPILGAALTLGMGAGSVGTASVTGAGTVSLSSPAGASAMLSLGSNSGASGVLAVSGGSTISVTADPGRADVFIGGGGSGVATFSGASSLAVPGGNVFVGREASGSGILRVEGGSSITAAYVGVGATPGVNTGVAQMIVNGTSTVTATTIEIGSRGYVGGTGTLVGNVINRGIFNPGNSPGTMTIDGSFVNAAGGQLVLEVESDGAGGYTTDRLVFAGGAPNLAGVLVSFSFLGGTDPVAFQSAGLFNIGQFLRVGSEPIAPALLAGASYAASSSAFVIANFSYSPQAGASFVATPVPEPATWLLFAAGAATLIWRLRRRTA